MGSFTSMAVIRGVAAAPREAAVLPFLRAQADDEIIHALQRAADGAAVRELHRHLRRARGTAFASGAPARRPDTQLFCSWLDAWHARGNACQVAGDGMTAGALRGEIALRRSSHCPPAGSARPVAPGGGAPCGCAVATTLCMYSAMASMSARGSGSAGITLPPTGIATVDHHRPNGFAGLVAEHQLRAQQVRAAQVAAAQVDTVAAAALDGIQRIAARDDGRITRRTLLRGKGCGRCGGAVLGSKQPTPQPQEPGTWPGKRKCSASAPPSSRAPVYPPDGFCKDAGHL